jgi:hypothetical protein
VNVLVSEPTPEGRVLGDGSPRPDVGKAPAGEELQGAVAAHAHRQTDGGPTIQDLCDPGFQIQVVELRHGSPFVLADGDDGDDGQHPWTTVLGGTGGRRCPQTRIGEAYVLRPHAGVHRRRSGRRLR